MFFHLDQQSRAPVYEQLKQQLLKLAAQGIIKEDAQLPSVRQLAQDLGVNPNTIQTAYRELEREQLIYSVPAKGSFLAARADNKARELAILSKACAELVKQAQALAISKTELSSIFASALQTEE